MPGNARQTIAGSLLLLAGGAIGASLGILFAPQSGKKTRKQISRYGRRMRNETEEMARRTADSVLKFTDDMGERTSDLVDRGGEVAEDLRKNLIGALESGQKALEHQRKRLSRFWG